MDTKTAEISHGLGSDKKDDVISAMDALTELVKEGIMPVQILDQLDMLMMSPDQDLRKRALLLVGKFALKKVGHMDSVSILNDMLRDPDPDIRENAAWALGEMAGFDVGELCTPYYLNYPLTDEIAEVRAMAAWAEGRYAERMGVGRNDTLRLLKQLLDDESNQVRKGAEWSLQRFKEIGLTD